jgi:hypothetical protein
MGAAPALTAGCLCGAIRFELSPPPALAGYCHCTRCQRRTGTSSSAQVVAGESSVAFLRGEELVQGWRPPGEGMEKCFCRECGAHLFSRHPASRAIKSVRMSAFDGDPGVRPSFRQFVAYAAAWEPIPDDGLERFDEARPG